MPSAVGMEIVICGASGRRAHRPLNRAQPHNEPGELSRKVSMVLILPPRKTIGAIDLALGRRAEGAGKILYQVALIVTLSGASIEPYAPAGVNARRRARKKIAKCGGICGKFIGGKGVFLSFFMCQEKCRTSTDL